MPEYTTKEIFPLNWVPFYCCGLASGDWIDGGTSITGWPSFWIKDPSVGRGHESIDEDQQLDQRAETFSLWDDVCWLTVTVEVCSWLWEPGSTPSTSCVQCKHLVAKCYRRKVNTRNRVQILDQAVCISHSANTLEKGMNPDIFSLAMAT